MGYLTYTTQGGSMDLFGAPFINVGGTQCDIQNVKLGEGANPYGADVMMVYNLANQDWDVYNWFNEVYDENWQSLKKPGWGDMGSQIQYRTLNPGQGFWLQTQSDCTVEFKAPL